MPRYALCRIYCVADISGAHRHRGGASIDSSDKFPSALGLARFMRGLFSIFGSLTASKCFKYLIT